MNRYQKEYLQANIKNEKQTLAQLKTMYQEALQDINNKIEDLLKNPELQSKIYQARYQKALKRQIEEILSKIDDYKTINEYLEDCYENNYIGVLYDIQKQGIPVISPLNQEKVLLALTKDTKLTDPLYTRLGYDKKKLAEAVNYEISRGIASSLSYIDIARNVNKKYGIGVNRAMTIAITEGHRVSQIAAHEAQKAAAKAGARVVKQWDATLDGRTRLIHRKLDGQIREIDDYFEMDGHRALYPSGFGEAAQDIRCRCVALQRARWDLDEEELETLKQRAEYFNLDKSDSFDEFKKKYLNIKP